MKTALVTGASGQDGAYLCRLLLEKNYRVVAATRSGQLDQSWRLRRLGIEGEVEPLALDLSEYVNVVRALSSRRPDEIYNLASYSSPARSFDSPVVAADVGAIGVLRLLEAVRLICPVARVFQASSSEMFGRPLAAMQDEHGALRPTTPYGAAKLYAHWTVVNHRESHGLHASSGILFNHESPLRGPEFVTRKVSLGLCRIAGGGDDVLAVGDLSAARDWGFAGDYVEGMWRMLQAERPDDYILATGKSWTVRRLIELFADAYGFDLVWRGEGIEEIGLDRASGRQLVRIDPAFFRGGGERSMVGNPAKALEHLGWQPVTGFEQLVVMMAEAECAQAEPRNVA